MGVLLVMVTACGDSGSSSGGSGNRAEGQDAGSSSAGSGAVPYEAPVCNQVCQDYLSGLGLNTTVWLLFNQNVAGTPVGAVDLMGTCPLGGTAQITGTSAVATDGTSTAHLLFDLHQCHNSGTRFSLTFTGTVSMDGTFNNGSSGQSKFTAITLSGTSVVVGGSVKFLDDPAISLTCDLAVTQQGSDQTATLDGQICDREFNSETAFDYLDSSGGTSAADGGGNGSGAAGMNGAADGGAAGSGNTDGLCISDDQGGCNACTSGSSACAADAACCALGPIGFCTNLSVGACVACGSTSDCDPGQTCCH